ncbi:MAG: URC4/urg3 family protein [Oscillatoria sp. PMC 1068.18]|nr:URC4/urg3 family protein [Oscillatoria sp. PMC 1076.18]MEC4989173.1 URC4/urg3 family protein [Oscillatoria sp. PMC 1068.18]
MNENQKQLITYLRTPEAIREQCDRLFQLSCEDRLKYFRVQLDRLDNVVDYVIEVTQENYPDVNIPFHSRWRHFQVGGVGRLEELNKKLSRLSPVEKAKVKFDLAIVSVLLDAGAGSQWSYQEAETGKTFRRSEGLAVSSFRMFCQGLFASSRDRRVNAKGLQELSKETLAKGLQISKKNPLIGLEGRLALLQHLGTVLSKNSEFFGEDNPRPGNLVNYLLEKKENNSALSASEVLIAVLESLGEIWTGSVTVGGVKLGDVWQHSALSGNNYVPLHKLSQWLTYSLLEPLQELGLIITELDQLTGLAEYRNGGLCLDLGLLEVKEKSIFREAHLVSSEVIVEWRALTVILLDKIAARMREKLGMSATELPLVKVLQGGTWNAGRRIANQLRENGVPPLEIKSDGTVF